MAILFHTHEYEYLHKGLPYDGPFGEVDPLNRNWLLFLTDTGKYHRGDLVDANEFYKKPDGSKPLTINPVDLPWELFDFAIGDWSYSFYFFRTDCDVSDQITDQEGLTLMEVYNSVKKERVCLNITSFNCRNYPDDAAHCSGQDVPLYDITKGWAPN